MARRLLAQDLLSNCVSLEQQLDVWYAAANAPRELHQPVILWVDDAVDAQIPFGDTFGFADSLHALMFIYYWSALVLFHPCIRALHDAIFHPVLDAFPQVYPNLPAHLQAVDPSRYCPKEVRELAANVCRSLDYALRNSAQPDLLVAPLFIVEEFYREINASAGDGQLELMWCEAFRQRLTAKGQDMSQVLQKRSWQEMGNW